MPFLQVTSSRVVSPPLSYKNLCLKIISLLSYFLFITNRVSKLFGIICIHYFISLILSFYNKLWQINDIIQQSTILIFLQNFLLLTVFHIQAI